MEPCRDVRTGKWDGRRGSLWNVANAANVAASTPLVESWPRLTDLPITGEPLMYGPQAEPALESLFDGHHQFGFFFGNGSLDTVCDAPFAMLL
jgi:hypothetical protein